MKTINYLAYLITTMVTIMLFSAFEAEFEINSSAYVNLSAESMYFAYTSSSQAGSQSPLVVGDASPVVEGYKRKLYYMGRLYEVDGQLFNETMRNAVVAYQRERGLESNGILGQGTMSALDQERVTYRRGMKGPEIAYHQQTLMHLGYLPKSRALDGVFDDETYLAVVRYQHLNSLNTTGVIDPDTQDRMQEPLSRQISLPAS
jgi:peptidoglycan hydrolase-like protein with peptidoglycan-binding domain